MLRRIVVLLAAAVTFTMHSSAQVSDWTPPIGIPAPPFGVHETAPADPSPWTSATTGFYYVDATQAASTDSSNPLGTPDKPRKTIPLTLPAGAVVEVRGTYSVNHRSPSGLTMNGTATSPVFIRGKSPTERTAATQPWEVHGSYFVVENFDFSVDHQFLLISPILRGVLRDSTLRGTLSGGGIAVGGGAGNSATDVVLFRNIIHDNGDLAATYDQDVHGVVVASYVTNLWILENELYRNSGDGIQINAGNQTLQATTNHIYVGRNYSHENKQTGMWTKQAVDVIFSENLSSGHRPGNSSGGAGMGFQYAPERVWFLYNHIHNCEFGIQTMSDSGLGSGQYSFFIGNVIHNIHRTYAFNPDSAWGHSAMMLAGGLNRSVVNNTVYDVDSGIHSPGSGSLAIVNNIVAALTEPLGSQVYLEFPETATASTLSNNLFGGTVRLKWGSNTAYDLSSFRSTFGKGDGSINADPALANPAAEQFNLLANSPAIDHGTVSVVYEAFRAAYGLDIAVDPRRTPRPAGAAWDIGAYEGAGPRPPTNLRIIR